MKIVGQRAAACSEQLSQDSAASAKDGSPNRRRRASSKWITELRSTLQRRRGIVIGTAIGVLLLGVGIWQLVLNSPLLGPGLPTFSKAQAISRALTALQQFEQPERLESAARDFNAILDVDPENAAAVAGMSLVYSFRYANDMQDETWLQRATASAQQSIKLDSQLALSHVAQAWVVSKQGKHDLALAECERALALEPGHYFAMFGKTEALRQLRRYEEARQAAEQAMQLYPGQRSFADMLGTVFFEQGNYDAAEQVFRHSIQLQPDSAFAYANLNATLLRLNRSDEALRTLQQGLQVRPNGLLYSSLGNALFKRGDYVGAADAFERAVTPPFGNPNNYLRWANLGDTLLWIPGKGDQAQNAYKKALKLLEPRLDRTPQDATLMSRMGLYSVRAGDSARGEDLSRRASEAAPTSPDVHFRAGLAYELLGKRDLALAALAQAKQNGYPSSAIDSEPDLVGLRRDIRYLSQPTNGVKQ